MQIHVENLWKRFQSNWIFKNIQFEFSVPIIYGIAGPNGSGKSTLLQILAGLIPPSKGKVIYNINGSNLPEDEWYKYISYGAPYAEVYDYLTIAELLNHHQNFRSFYKEVNTENFIKLSYVRGHE
ncbi:MAG: ATP-binding cassette domain-containing protein [Saprospiraceae bacterium]|nr:ATP-binding cassette domain-containing protein [Saprospiraceae bacterium]